MDDNGNITCNDYNNSSIKEASEVKIVGEAETWKNSRFKHQPNGNMLQENHDISRNLALRLNSNNNE